MPTLRDRLTPFANLKQQSPPIESIGSRPRTLRDIMSPLGAQGKIAAGLTGLDEAAAGIRDIKQGQPGLGSVLGVAAAVPMLKGPARIAANAGKILPVTNRLGVLLSTAHKTRSGETVVVINIVDHADKKIAGQFYGTLDAEGKHLQSLGVADVADGFETVNTANQLGYKIGRLSKNELSTGKMLQVVRAAKGFGIDPDKVSFFRAAGPKAKKLDRLVHKIAKTRRDIAQSPGAVDPKLFEQLEKLETQKVDLAERLFVTMKLHKGKR